MLEQQSNSGPLQVAELQSELATVRNQLSTLSSKQALIEQYERRLKDSSDQAEKLSSQLNSLALNLQAKETMVIYTLLENLDCPSPSDILKLFLTSLFSFFFQLSNKEEMINILQDSLDRTREEMKMLKDKSVSKSPFALPWKNGKKKMVRLMLSIFCMLFSDYFRRNRGLNCCLIGCILYCNLFP